MKKLHLQKSNKHRGIRATLCWTDKLASLAPLHNNANVLCMPSCFVSLELAEKMIGTFLSTAFEGDRYEKKNGENLDDFYRLQG